MMSAPVLAAASWLKCCNWVLSSPIELNPKSADANYNLGLTYFKMGKNSRALPFFKKAIELNPEYKKIIKLFLGS